VLFVCAEFKPSRNSDLLPAHVHDSTPSLLHRRSPHPLPIVKIYSAA
jgi:hypothetical protein